MNVYDFTVTAQDGSQVALKDYAGKEKVKIAFKYVSTTAVAPTWEIKTVSIK